MAAILMICMVSFVFCTGMRGDMGEKLLELFRPKGATIATVAGRGVSLRHLHELKSQREMVNNMMRFCADRAFVAVSKRLHEEEKKQQAGEKGAENRAQLMSQLAGLQLSLADRKAKKSYFDIGVKFDDLLEFTLWQGVADRLGIRLDDDHIEYMFGMEFYNQLSREDLIMAQNEARRAVHNANDAFIKRAITEEFRVQIAQYAVIGSQPSSFFLRPSRQNEFVPKLTRPDVPDEVRAPLTLAQLYDFYRKQRAEFDVTLIPVHVKDFVKEAGEPGTIDRKNFFDAHKNKPFDPSSPEWGLQVPPQIKIEYVMADPNSPAYLDLAKAKSPFVRLKMTRDKALIEATSPLAWSGLQTPIGTAASFMAVAQRNKMALEKQFDEVSQLDYRSVRLAAGNGTLPMVAWAAKRHPEAAASAVAASFLTPTDGYSALAGYLAWGATKDATAITAGEMTELRRRAPWYAELFAATTSTQPLETIVPLAVVGAQPPPLLPVEIVEPEFRTMIARRSAEDWARDSIHVVKKELESAQGDAQKFQRVLKKLVPELKLTYGPPADAKSAFYDRYTIDSVKEFEPLREAYLRYIDMINLFEGRDTKPETLLKPGDYYKMFFDQSESFSATSPYRAMAWPPSITPSNVRAWKGDANPRLIDRSKINMDVAKQFMTVVRQNDPNRQAPSFDLFDNAEKPVLYWRTADATSMPLTDFDKIERELKKTNEGLTKLAEDMKATKDAAKLLELKKKEVELTHTASDLKRVQSRVDEGWKFERARINQALPKAKAIAQDLISNGNNPELVRKYADAMKRDLIVLNDLSRMFPERLPNHDVDYFNPPLPKDKFTSEYPRDDMMKQAVGLYDMKGAYEISFADLDKINRELYEKVKGEKSPEFKYVQIFTNKPRSIFYVALISKLPMPDQEILFVESLRKATYPDRLHPNMNEQMRQFFYRDYFVPRAQEAEAKRLRADTIEDLGRILGFSIEDREARKQFDENKGGD